MVRFEYHSGLNDSAGQINLICRTSSDEFETSKVIKERLVAHAIYQLKWMPEFQQGDESIVVLGKLRQVIRPAINQETAEPESMDVIAAPVGKEDSDKRTVTVAVEKTKPAGEARRKKMVRTAVVDTNEPKSQGSIEGKP